MNTIKTKIDFEQVCKDKYLNKNDKIIYEKIKITHDGFDCYGPQSYIYDYLIFIEINNKIHYQEFHREDWLDSEIEHYYPTFRLMGLEEKLFERTLPIKEEIYLKLDKKNKSLFLLNEIKKNKEILYKK
jgi:hypothetical protein